MCLIALGYLVHTDYRLVVAANRDEFFDRPASPLHAWPDGSGIIAGRDERALGTWMGVTREGRFSAITNYREVGLSDAAALSRGRIPLDFLRDGNDPEAFAKQLDAMSQRFNGFNVLAADANRLCYYSNRGGGVRELTPGIYGLSNHLLDTPWPKVQRAKAAIEEAMRSDDLDVDALLLALRDTRRAEGAALPDTGVGVDLEKKLSPIFINFEGYGTRSSTVLLLGHDGSGRIIEQAYTEDGSLAQRVDVSFADASVADYQ